MIEAIIATLPKNKGSKIAASEPEKTEAPKSIAAIKVTA